MKLAESVVLFLIDGLRPDGLQQAQTPNIDKLMANGSYTLQASSTMPSVTLPCLVSMFLGSDLKALGIKAGPPFWAGTWQRENPSIPSIIDLVHQAEMSTMSFYNWEWLRDLSRLGSLDVGVYLNNCEVPEGDLEIANIAAKQLSKKPAAFTFVYLGYLDITGHNNQWMSPPYIEAIANADKAIGIVLDVLAAVGRMDKTALIVTSDHGGHENTHGTDMPEDMTVPWIISGCGIAGGQTLAGSVCIIDTAPTVATILGLGAPEQWTGKVIRQVFAGA